MVGDSSALGAGAAGATVVYNCCVMSGRAGKPKSYLAPYVSAAERHAGGFRSLLWASVSTQEKRFDAFTRVCDFAGKSILDVGCGRADLLDYLLGRGIEPDHYVGLEAVQLL